MTERNQTTGIDQAALLVALLVFSWQIVQLPGAWLPINSFIGLVLLLLIGAYSQPTSHRKLGQIWPSSHLARKIFHGRRRQTHQAYREGQEDQLGVAGPGRFTRFTRSITTKLGQIRLQIAAVAVGASIAICLILAWPLQEAIVHPIAALAHLKTDGADLGVYTTNVVFPVILVLAVPLSYCNIKEKVDGDSTTSSERDAVSVGPSKSNSRARPP
jgi:hypothetical protein